MVSIEKNNTLNCDYIFIWHLKRVTTLKFKIGFLGIKTFEYKTAKEEGSERERENAQLDVEK